MRACLVLLLLAACVASVVGQCANTTQTSGGCPLGMYTVDGHCSACPAGSYSLGHQCVSCWAGTYSANACSGSCTGCSVGQTSTAGQSACVQGPAVTSGADSGYAPLLTLLLLAPLLALLK